MEAVKPRPTMKRRHFLQALSMAAPGAALVPPAAASAAKHHQETTANGKSKEPRVFFYDDGRHYSGLYQFAPPLEAADLTYAVDQLVDSGVDTLLYSAGLEGGAVQYGSQVAQKWGDNVDVWVHPIFYRASRNLQQLVADGNDPMRILAERCHQKGIWFIPTCPVCIIGGGAESERGYGRKSDFVFDNPQFYVGEDDHPQAELLGRMFGTGRLNFLHAEVRRERFQIFEELLTRYESDGVELDLSLDNEFGPFCRFGEVAQLAPVLTQWIRDIREVARTAEQAQGRRKRVYIRIPSGPPSMWRIPGFEVETWVSEKLVDGLVCMSPYKKETPRNALLMFDQDLDLSAAVRLTRGTGCRVLAGITSSLGRQLESTATGPMVWAAAALAYDKGADGFGLSSGGWVPNGWPWTAAEYETLRYLGHPELLATADKNYRVRSLARGASDPKPLFPIQDPILPQRLPEGKPVNLPLAVADDLPRWQALGRVKSVRLRVRVTSIEPSLDKMAVTLNGRSLPDAIRNDIDLHFRVLKNMAVGPYGYILEYHLPPDHYPRKGTNQVGVTLVKRDPRISGPVDVVDVDCHIDYRHHRNFEDSPIQY